MLKKLLKYFRVSGSDNLDIDKPETTVSRKNIIENNRILKEIYNCWYSLICNNTEKNGDTILEIGSGAGFLEDYIKGVLTSDIIQIPGISLTQDAQNLAMADKSLDSVAMVNTFHHFPRSSDFFRELQRCLKVGGRLVMIEPWYSKGSYFIYNYLHHEPFDTKTQKWEFPAAGPLSGANIALPWIVFKRDREKFEKLYPDLKIKTVMPLMPFMYLLSGGMSYRNFVPQASYPIFLFIEKMLKPFYKYIAMFVLIVVEKEAG